MDNLNVPINDDDLAEKADELKQNSDYSANSKFGRELLRAAHEAYETADTDDPFKAVREGGSDSETVEIDYDSDERRREQLTPEEVQALVRTVNEPTINPLHVPGDAGGELKTLNDRVELCLGVARYQGDTLTREQAEEIVEDVIGRGSNDYFVDPDRADVPGQMRKACYHEPRLPGVSQDRARYTSSDVYVAKWAGLAQAAVERDPADLSDNRLKTTMNAASRLAEQGDELLLALDDDGEMDTVELFLDRLETVGEEMTAEAEGRGLLD